MIAAGPGARDKDGKLIPMDVSIGDEVMLPEHGGQKLKFDADEYYLYSSDDILGVFKA